MAKEDFDKLSDDIVDYIKNVEKDFNIPLDISFSFTIELNAFKF